MGQPQSSISTAITVRLSNDLIERIKDWAKANNCINNTGQSDKRGKPNLSQALTELVNTGLDSIVFDTVTQDSESDFVTRAELDQRLGELTSLITVKLNSGQAIATPKTKHNQLDLTDMQAIAANPDIAESEHLYPIGTEIKLHELAKYLGFDRSNYTAQAKRKNISLEDCINQYAIAKGEVWKRTEYSKNDIKVTRIS